ncbi:MAG: DNA topoisomerase III [Clostridiales bacterium]|nr:DNA topoisomerase III [Clostridiales bacterium]MCF8022357.1 DNA topoisomerase III [Clostridiales bacterium]
MKSLVLAEKPSVARDLAGVLGKFQNKDGYLENSEYIVTWAIGHLVELAGPEDYDKTLKSWRLDTLPVLPDKFRLKPNPNTIKQFKIVKELVNRSDIDQLICATDAGREGELIFRYIYHLSGSQKPFKRLWLSETTPEAVKKGFENLYPGSKFDRLADAAKVRSQADWLVGINATRAFTVKHNALLSIGRVQTPTLGLIVNREREIRNFIPSPYWELIANFDKGDGQFYLGKWFHGDQSRFTELEKAEQVKQKVTGQAAAVAEVKEKEVKEQPPLLFNLNDLQKEANKKYGLSADKTLKIAQDLYETKKLITYPRTDSRHITQALAGTLKKRLDALSAVDKYIPYIEKASSAAVPGKRYVNDAKVSDHTALLPTETKPNINNLADNEKKVYDLVARRFMAIFFPAARYKQTRVITEASGETFITTGRVELARGWKSVYEQLSDKKDSADEEETASLPPLEQDEKVDCNETEVKEKQTQAPKRYTEAGLLAVMEGAGKLLDNEELKDAMKGSGMGTPATRAAIIERLIKVGYIERKKKSLVPTEKGEALIDLVPEFIKSPEITGKWEKFLADIEEGNAKPGEFMNGIIILTRDIVNRVSMQEVSNVAQQQKEILGKCPLCGCDVIENKKGYGCSGYKNGCKFIIWKEIAGKKITCSQAKKLLEKGKTGIIKGFKSRKGNKFDAALILKDDKVEFQFENAESDSGREAIGKCLLCGKDVIENAKGYGCSGYKDGCKFIIWKNIAGKKITSKQARELLQKGKTGKLKGFKSKSGKSFDAVLVLGEGGKINFDFNGR